MHFAAQYIFLFWLTKVVLELKCSLSLYAFCVVVYLFTRQGRLRISLAKFRLFSIDLNLRWDVT